MRVYIETYGCALNKADSSLMKALLISRGHEIVGEVSDADVVVVNTCTVRRDSEERILKRLKELSRLNKKLVITGCMVATQPYTLKQVVPTASLISPQNIVRIVDAVESNSIVNLIIGVRDTSKLVCSVEGAIASIPIAEGCLGNCSYCIVKLARRRLVSYKPELIVGVVREVVGKGVVEVELTAQDTASYGLDLGNVNLPKLLRMIIDNVDGNYMIRVGMANPDTIEPILDELIEVLKEPKVFKYLHIPLQSGDDKVLKIMNRKYSVDTFVGIVRELRRKIPGISIATDVIVGHPGEGDEEFENTVKVINEVQPDKVHIAQYTPRPRTEASAMPQVSEGVKKLRSSQLTRIVEEVGMKINKEYVGSLAKVLVVAKGFRRNSLICRTYNYKPVVIHEDLRVGSSVDVVITDATYYDLRGRLYSI
ncbi:MAG: tRNA (N(6)-L-threonylcarbamoyladenosine(37)-C(2))-methylthiotransferase [Desulfurococcaceae archaeon]|nr:tRNA (N(6)-L-threonylcarbamoyladenosine(37)-C(2))-methylthiotransferase [Desulfurococcaceae archaeon]